MCPDPHGFDLPDAPVSRTDVVPFRVVVYGKDNEVLYDRALDDQQLWTQAPGLYFKITRDRMEANEGS